MEYYIDTHAHILSEEFRDVDEVLERAEKAGVRRIMIMCTREEEAEKAVRYVEKDPFRFGCAYGIHPEDVLQAEARWDTFCGIIRDPRISCVGEIGLDYYWQKDTKEEQKELFIRQTEEARKVKKPVLIHSRDAIGDTLEIMKAHRIPAVMHCFPGSAEMAAEFTKLGCMLAFGGVLTFKNARHSVHAAAAVDAKYLLSETDCPYMAPEPVRGTRNEPANIPYIVRKLAEIRGIPETEMMRIIAENYERFLREPVV